MTTSSVVAGEVFTLVIIIVFHGHNTAICPGDVDPDLVLALPFETNPFEKLASQIVGIFLRDAAPREGTRNLL